MSVFRLLFASAVGHLLGTVPTADLASRTNTPAEMAATADALAHDLLRTEGVLAVERYRVGAPVGVHAGAESLEVFWWPKP